MELKLNPVEIFDVLSDRKHRNRDQVGEFVYAAAKEAKDLANIWNHIVSQLLVEQPIDYKKLSDLKTHRFLPHNGGPTAHLAEFYQQASSVIGPQSESWLNSVCNYLGAILYQRRLAIEEFNNLYDENFSTENHTLINTSDKLDSLVSVVNRLYKEAASLDVLAQAIKAGVKSK